MSRKGVCSTLDGNAAGGLLSEIFAFEATAARTTCAGCTRIVAMGELRLYSIEMGAILRCPSCEQVVVRVARTPRGFWLDLRGASSVVEVSAEARWSIPEPSARKSSVPSSSASRPHSKGRSR
jgi:hypothetical protein